MSSLNLAYLRLALDDTLSGVAAASRQRSGPSVAGTDSVKSPNLDSPLLFLDRKDSDLSGLDTTRVRPNTLTDAEVVAAIRAHAEAVAAAEAETDAAVDHGFTSPSSTGGKTPNARGARRRQGLGLGFSDSTLTPPTGSGMLGTPLPVGSEHTITPRGGGRPPRGGGRAGSPVFNTAPRAASVQHTDPQPSRQSSRRAAVGVGDNSSVLLTQDVLSTLLPLAMREASEGGGSRSELSAVPSLTATPVHEVVEPAPPLKPAAISVYGNLSLETAAPPSTASAAPQRSVRSVALTPPGGGEPAGDPAQSPATTMSILRRRSPPPQPLRRPQFKPPSQTSSEQGDEGSSIADSMGHSVPAHTVSTMRTPGSKPHPLPQSGAALHVGFHDHATVLGQSRIEVAKLKGDGQGGLLQRRSRAVFATGDGDRPPAAMLSLNTLPDPARRKFNLPVDVVNKVLRYVADARDLRACVAVSRTFLRAIGSFNGVVGRRLANSWQPYSGVWWIPRDAHTIMLVHMDLDIAHTASGNGWMLKKVVTRHPFTGNVTATIEKKPRAVTVDLTPSTATVRWFAPIDAANGTRTSETVHNGIFDCSAVVKLTPTTCPTPGRPIPRVLYLAQQGGGTLNVFPDSHLRRPKSRSAWREMDRAVDALTRVLERSDWASVTAVKAGNLDTDARHGSWLASPQSEAALEPTMRQGDSSAASMLKMSFQSWKL